MNTNQPCLKVPQTASAIPHHETELYAFRAANHRYASTPPRQKRPLAVLEALLLPEPLSVPLQKQCVLPIAPELKDRSLHRIERHPVTRGELAFRKVECELHALQERRFIFQGHDLAPSDTEGDSTNYRVRQHDSNSKWRKGEPGSTKGGDASAQSFTIVSRLLPQLSTVSIWSRLSHSPYD